MTSGLLTVKDFMTHAQDPNESSLSPMHTNPPISVNKNHHFRSQFWAHMAIFGPKILAHAKNLK